LPPGAPATQGHKLVSPRVARVLERIVIVVVALAIAVGIIAVLSGGLLAGRDNPGVSDQRASVGVKYRDQGHAHLAPGSLHPVYNTNPPTSGAHVPEPVLHDDSVLNDDQLLQALETGNVVFMYGTPKPPPGLPQLASQVAGPFSPALAASGQAVILARRPRLRGLIGLAWTRAISVASVSDPRLRGFAELWLGKGAPGG
jgi:hypothetical protein